MDREDEFWEREIRVQKLMDMYGISPVLAGAADASLIHLAKELKEKDTGGSAN